MSGSSLHQSIRLSFNTRTSRQAKTSEIWSKLLTGLKVTEYYLLTEFLISHKWEKKHCLYCRRSLSYPKRLWKNIWGLRFSIVWDGHVEFSNSRENMILQRVLSILTHQETSQKLYQKNRRRYMRRLKKRYSYHKISGFNSFLKSKKMLRLWRLEWSKLELCWQGRSTCMV